MADVGQVEEENGKKILIAVDGSKHSIFAFEWYADKIHEPTDDVIIGFCSEIGTNLPSNVAQTSPATLHALIEKHEEKTKEIFSTFDSLATKYNVQHKLERLHDPPGPSIVKYAYENNVQLIVVGSRGHGTFRRTILGSVSDYIVHHSHVPVIICKHHDEHHKFK
ncbi:universal stress protein YxiE-like [Mercenaria mercenaria]|uniref:universal stress protein YxiE-like n=1 Tax=Mercenaria mercenaria TaxID=6596 RepID=UPI00234E9F4C|nr:universal stress protein YxiE-like [Mercenaria mercenaria]